MALDLQASAPPLDVDSTGVARVRGTRVALELLVDAFAEGASAEEIVLRYPTLQLVDVYAVLAYVLRDPSGVDAYMTTRATCEADVGERLPPEMTRLRTRLLSRRDEG